MYEVTYRAGQIVTTTTVDADDMVCNEHTAIFLKTTPLTVEEMRNRAALGVSSYQRKQPVFVLNKHLFISARKIDN